MEKKKRYITLDNIFGESFRLYFKNIIPLMAPAIPVFVILGIVFYRYFAYLTETADSGLFESAEMFALMAMMFGVMLFFYPLIYLEIKIASNAYLEISENLTDIAKESLKRFFPFLGMHILFGLATSLASLLLVFPAYILMFGWCVFQTVFIIEKEKAVDSLKRSWDLTRGNKGRIFLFFLMGVAAFYFFILFIGLIFGGMAAAMSGGFGALQTIESTETVSLITTLVLMVFYSFLFPLFSSIITVIYYNLRKEKEGFETTFLADSFLEADGEGETDHI